MAHSKSAVLFHTLYIFKVSDKLLVTILRSSFLQISILDLCAAYTLRSIREKSARLRNIFCESIEGPALVVRQEYIQKQTLLWL